MRFADLKIAKKIMAAFAVMVVGAAAMGTAVFLFMANVEDAAVAKVQHMDIETAAMAARFDVARQEGSLRGFMITRDDYFAERTKDHYQTFLKDVAKVRALVGPDSDMASRLDALEAAMSAWHTEIADPVIQFARSEMTYPQALALFKSGKADKFIEPIEETLDGIRDRKLAQIEEANVLEQDMIFDAELAILLGMAFLIIAAAGLGWLLSRGIASPINTMTDVMRRLADGDKTVVVEGAGRGDEIGAMAAAVESFKQAAIERERLEAEAAAARIDQEQAKQRQASLDNAKAEDLRAFVGVVEVGFERLSAGDLTVRMAEPVAAEFEPIRAKFNDSVGKLEDAIGNVVTSIGSIRSGLQEINTASNDLAQRTEQQAANLEETVAALGEVTTAVNETAEGAGKAQ
ncbi:MAG TPA: methyl-accepting chemotaxis protein, partial [Aurantimonas coralicida]|nr:methyl-accepting chemotaxis protein [Aurantimonas coralicida]